MSFPCPYCHKDLDIMNIQMDEDLRFVFQALPSFGTRYSHLVMGYCQLFGVTPFSIKSKKLRLLIEEMTRLFESQKFSYQKRTYAISHAGIGEALDIMIKRHWNEPIDGHNYLKKVMITISEREEKDGSRKSDANLKKREDLHRAQPISTGPSPAGENGIVVGGGDDPELQFSAERRQSNLSRVRDIIKSIGG